MAENENNINGEEKAKEVFFEIIGTKANDVTRENANMNADTPAGMMMQFASETTKTFVDDYLLSDEAREAVKSGHIYVHDKDYYPTKSLTCLQHPLDKILKEGFRAGQGASRAAKRIETAEILACVSMETVQNEMHGGQAIPAFDFYLAPYVKLTFKEELNKIGDFMEQDVTHLYNYEVEEYIKKPVDGLKGEERLIQEAINNTVTRVQQSMDAFINNMNAIPSRGGNQVVFSSINYGTDTSAEGRCIIREILLSTERGVGNHETAIFPIQIWKKKKGVNYLPEDKNYDLYQNACKVAGKRFYPNFINLDATFNQNEKWDINDPKRYQYECATMGCRTRVYENRFGDSTSIGRGNLSVTTLNLPRIAIESSYEAQEKLGMKFELGRGSEKFITETYAKEVKEIFMNKLEHYAELTARQLYDRYKFQCTAVKKQFPLLMSGLWMDSEKLKSGSTVEDVLKHGTLEIGFIGLAECLTALTGKHHGESEESQKLGIEIVRKLYEKAKEFSDKYNLNFAVLATPAESLSGKFTKIDKAEYGNILGVTDREYYTNSNHVPVWYKCSAQHKAEIEAPYHELTRGGHIFYVELDGEATNNPENIAKVVDLMDKYNMGYCAVNHTRTRCTNCGFETERTNLPYCPICDSEEIDTIQRITGYLVGTTSRWNASKLAELRDRVTHTI